MTEVFVIRNPIYTGTWKCKHENNKSTKKKSLEK